MQHRVGSESQMANPSRRYPRYQLPPPLSFEGFTCVYCGCVLNTLDSLRCKNKRFNRVQKNGKYHGACTNCLESALTIERTVYPTELVQPWDLEVKAGRPWGRLIVRCYYCGTPLNKDEKKRHIMFKEPFVKARGTFKGRCIDCAGDARRPPHGQTSTGPRP